MLNRNCLRQVVSRYGLVVIFVLLCLLSLCVGANGLGFRALFSPSRDGMLILTASRLPRLIALVLTGAGLAISGVILQQILRNRFAEPATVGSMEAAKLGILVALTIMPGSGALLRMAFAMLFCLAACTLFVTILRRIRLRDVVLVPVIGLMFGAVLGALAEFYAFRNNNLQSMQGWMLGDFSKIVQGHYELIYLVFPVVAITYLYTRHFTLLAMGQDMAESLGLGYQGMVALGLTLVSAVVGATVITAGSVPFVGLVVPNLVSLWMGDNLQRSLPVVAMSGALLLVVCDIISRLILFPYEVPLGLTVGIIGGTMFLAVILRGPR